MRDGAKQKKKDPVPTLETQLCFALYRASRAMTRAYQPLLEPLGLTYPQYLVLLALWREDGVSVKALGEQLELDSATLTPLLKRLENQDIVARTRCTEDERVVRIRLTDAGRALREKARAIPRAVARQAGFDPDDGGALASLLELKAELERLTAALEA
ncbi:MAG TPA: MarR family transcriptional regulator [Myxococcota bacterium]|nr:MarR family transcriptional regulator [Myxococcota bacterium]